MNSKEIEALKPRVKRYSIAIGHGLAVRVHPTGRKTFVVRITKDGHTSDKTIGNFPEMSLLSAKQKTRTLRKKFELQPPKGFTLRDAFKLWCQLKRGQIKSYADERRRLEKHIISKLGNRQLDEIIAPVVIQCVKPLDRSGNLATLKRVLMRLREVLDIAVCAGYIEHNPLSRVSRVFRAPKVVPMPSIEWTSLTEAFQAVDNFSVIHKALFLWSLATLLRPSECVACRYDWIKDGVLTIPKEHMKMQREFRVPVTPLMEYVIKVTKALDPRSRCPFLFKSRYHTKPMSSQTLAKELHKSPLKGRLVAHGIRSIGRTWFADHEASYEVSEMCLAHIVGSQVSRAYLRSDYLNQRRTLMYSWTSYVFDCAKSSRFFEGFPLDTESILCHSTHSPCDRPVTFEPVGEA